MQQTDTMPGTQNTAAFPPAKPAGVCRPRPPASGKSGGVLWVFILLIAAAGIGFIVWRAKSTTAAALALTKRVDFSIPVIPGKVTQQEVSLYYDGLGTVQAFNTVAVKARVDGQLVKVLFTEGQDVHTNDLLAEIDPGPFQAALDQATAKKLQDQALLDNAKLDLQRDLSLTNIVTLQTVDTQSNLVRQLEAMVKTDQAGIDSCKVQLDYTKVYAPLEGRCGIRLVDQGNVVHAADTNGLVVITQLRPISVVFTLPEQNVGVLSRKLAQGPERPVRVEALDRDNKTVLDKGTLAVIDNQIDTTTGTIKCKATFPNENLSLWPGQFINSHVLVDTTNGLVVAENVVQRGPDGPYVFTVHGEGSNLVAKLTPVTEGLRAGKMEEGWALVSEGLSVGETVVVDGQYRLEDGTKVRVEEGNQPAGSAAAPGRVNQPGAGAATNRPSTNQLPQQAGA